VADTCPSWCTRNHETGEVHLTVRKAPGAETWVSLTRTVIGDLLRIHNMQDGKSIVAVHVDLDLNGDRDMAELLARLGHEGIAAAIKELAALAKENPDAT
jgi:hypothetical protein